MLTGVHKPMQEGLPLWVYQINLSKQGHLQWIAWGCHKLRGKKNSPALPTLKQKLPAPPPPPCLTTSPCFPAST